MSLTSTEPRVRKALDEWRTMSRNGSFMLARMALADACTGFADAHVLMALTDAASRDSRRALEEVAKARTLLRDDNARLMTDVPRSRVATAAERLGALLEARTMVTPPKDLMEWLERPDLIPAPPAATTPKPAPSMAASPASRPSGLTSPPPTSSMAVPRPSAPSPAPRPPSLSASLASMPTAASMAMPASLALPSLPAPVLGTMAPMGGAELPPVAGAPATPLAPSPGAPAAEVAKALAAAGLVMPPPPPAPQPPPSAPASIPVAPAPAPPVAATPPWTPPPAPARPAPPPVAVAPAAPIAPQAPQPAAQPPSPWDDWERRLSAMAAAGQLSEAIRQAEEATAKYPQSARLAEFLAGLHKRAGATERAVESYLAAVERAGKSGHLDRAERAAREAIALSRQSATTLMHVAKVAAAAGVGAVAVVALREAASRMAATGEQPRLTMVLEFLSKRLPHDLELMPEVSRLKHDIVAALERGHEVAGEARAAAEGLRRELPPPASAQGGSGSRPPTLQIVGAPAAPAPPPQRVSPPTSGGQRISREDAQRRSRAMNMTSMEPAAGPPSAHGAPPRRGEATPRVTTVEAPSSLGYTLAGFSVLAIVLAMVTGSVIPGVLGFFISQAVVSAMGTKVTDQASLKAAQFARMAFVIAFFFGWVVPP